MAASFLVIYKDNDQMLRGKMQEKQEEKKEKTKKLIKIKAICNFLKKE